MTSTRANPGGAVADDIDSDSLLLASDSEMETETLPDQDRDLLDTDNTADEDEALEFADSPADGYFTSRDHPQHTFVHRSAVQAESDRKAREAAQSQAESHARRTMPPRATSAGPVDSPPFQNPALSNAPILDAGPAPPDYAAATAHRQMPSQSPRDDTSAPVIAHTNPYGNTHESSPPGTPTLPTADNNLYWPFGTRMPFGTSDRNDPELRTSLSRRQDPSGGAARPSTSSNPLLLRGVTRPILSMSDVLTRMPDEETGLLRQRRKRTRSTNLGCFIKLVIVLLVIAIIAIGALALSEGTAAGVPEYNKNPLEPTLPIPSSTPPESPTPPIQDLLPPSGTCSYSSLTSSVAFDFQSPASFSLSEFLQESESFSGGIYGKISVSNADSLQKPSLRVWVTYATTASWRVSGVNHVVTDTSLDLHLPVLRKQSQAGNRRPCLYLDIRIEVKEGTILEDWSIATTNLDISMDEALFNHTDPGDDLKITDASSITTTRGKVGGVWSSRNTKIETHSGSVKGRFAWMDLLSIRTFSGSIDVAVEPREADPQRSAAAEYVAWTYTGSIQTVVQTKSPDTDLPIREYRTRVQTSSGRISGTYIHGITTSFSTNSGSVDVDILPIDTRLINTTKLSTNTKDTRITMLRTDTLSGTTVLRLRSPFSPQALQTLSGDDDKQHAAVIDTLKSRHKSKSGSISLTYPEEWTGEIEGESSSGHITVEGRGVHNPWWITFFTHYFARKGDGDSALGMHENFAVCDVRQHILFNWKRHDLSLGFYAPPVLFLADLTAAKILHVPEQPNAVANLQAFDISVHERPSFSSTC
nr:hypothetical protein CFP56_11634 [Quercus suber]